MRSTLAVAVAALLASLGSAAAASAQSAPSPSPSASPPAFSDSASDAEAERIVRRLLALNARLNSYRVGVSIAVRMRSFPYLGTRLHGQEYFTAPDKFAIVFDRVPSLAKGFETLSGDVASPVGWIKMDDIAYAGSRKVEKRDDLVLRLSPKHEDPVEHEEATIDPASRHVDELRWFYRNGGRISMTQEYARFDGFDLVVAQHLTIRIPFVSGGAEARYERYETNVAVDPHVFEPKATPSPSATR